MILIAIKKIVASELVSSPGSLFLGPHKNKKKQQSLGTRLLVGHAG